MANEDWTISLGYDTSGIQDAFERQNTGGTSSGGQGGNFENSIAGGFSKGLKFAGIIGILTQLKVVTDSIAFVLGGLSGLFSYFVVSFIQNVVSFFQDPVRGLLDLGVFIVNKIIDGLNLVVMAINSLIPGTGSDISLLPNIDSEAVLEAYDAAKNMIKEAIGMTEDTSGALNDVTVKVEGLKTSADDMVDSLNGALVYIANEAKRVSRDPSAEIYNTGGTTGSNFFNYIGNVSRDPTVEAKRKGANKILKYLG